MSAVRWPSVHQDVAAASGLDHSTHMRLRRAGEAGEIVAALEHAYHAALRGPAGDGADENGEIGEIRVLQTEVAERIVDVAVEAGADEHQFRLEGLHRGQQLFFEALEDLPASAESGERTIERGALAFAFAGF